MRQATGSLRRVAVRAQCSTAGCETANGPKLYALEARHQIAEFSLKARGDVQVQVQMTLEDPQLPRQNRHSTSRPSPSLISR